MRKTVQETSLQTLFIFSLKKIINIKTKAFEGTW